MRSRFVVVGSLLIFVVSLAALAQLPTATILGTVTDTSGAVIPGASFWPPNWICIITANCALTEKRI